MMAKASAAGTPSFATACTQLGLSATSALSIADVEDAFTTAVLAIKDSGDTAEEKKNRLAAAANVAKTVLEQPEHQDKVAERVLKNAESSKKPVFAHSVMRELLTQMYGHLGPEGDDGMSNLDMPDTDEDEGDTGSVASDGDSLHWTESIPPQRWMFDLEDILLTPGHPKPFDFSAAMHALTHLKPATPISEVVTRFQNKETPISSVFFWLSSREFESCKSVEDASEFQEWMVRMGKMWRQFPRHVSSDSKRRDPALSEGRKQASAAASSARGQLSASNGTTTVSKAATSSSSASASVSKERSNGSTEAAPALSKKAKKRKKKKAGGSAGDDDDVDAVSDVSLMTKLNEELETAPESVRAADRRNARAMMSVKDRLMHLRKAANEQGQRELEEILDSAAPQVRSQDTALAADNVPIAVRVARAREQRNLFAREHVARMLAKYPSLKAQLVADTPWMQAKALEAQFRVLEDTRAQGELDEILASSPAIVTEMDKKLAKSNTDLNTRVKRARENRDRQSQVALTKLLASDASLKSVVPKNVPSWRKLIAVQEEVDRRAEVQQRLDELAAFIAAAPEAARTGMKERDAQNEASGRTVKQRLSALRRFLTWWENNRPDQAEAAEAADAAAATASKQNKKKGKAKDTDRRASSTATPLSPPIRVELKQEDPWQAAQSGNAGVLVADSASSDDGQETDDDSQGSGGGAAGDGVAAWETGEPGWEEAALAEAIRRSEAESKALLKQQAEMEEAYKRTQREQDEERRKLKQEAKEAEQRRKQEAKEAAQRKKQQEAEAAAQQRAERKQGQTGRTPVYLRPHTVSTVQRPKQPTFVTVDSDEEIGAPDLSAVVDVAADPDTSIDCAGEPDVVPVDEEQDLLDQAMFVGQQQQQEQQQVHQPLPASAAVLADAGAADDDFFWGVPQPVAPVTPAAPAGDDDAVLPPGMMNDLLASMDTDGAEVPALRRSDSAPLRPTVTVPRPGLTSASPVASPFHTGLSLWGVGSGVDVATPASSSDGAFASPSAASYSAVGGPTPPLGMPASHRRDGSIGNIGSFGTAVARPPGLRPNATLPKPPGPPPGLEVAPDQAMMHSSYSPMLASAAAAQHRLYQPPGAPQRYGQAPTQQQQHQQPQQQSSAVASPTSSDDPNSSLPPAMQFILQMSRSADDK